MRTYEQHHFTPLHFAGFDVRPSHAEAGRGYRSSTDHRYPWSTGDCSHRGAGACIGHSIQSGFHLTCRSELIVCWSRYEVHVVPVYVCMYAHYVRRHVANSKLDDVCFNGIPYRAVCRFFCSTRSGGRPARAWPRNKQTSKQIARVVAVQTAVLYIYIYNIYIYIHESSFTK